MKHAAGKLEVQGHLEEGIDHNADHQIVTIDKSRDATASRLNAIVGAEMQSVPGFAETKNEIPGKPLSYAGPQKSTDAPVENFSDARELLEDMGDDIQSLASMNMEHRVEDFWDNLPVFSNIRSHKLATREAQLIHALQGNLARLEDAVTKSGAKVDLTQLKKSITNLRAPGGATKWIGTLIPGGRSFHRSVFPRRMERIRQQLTDARRALREARG